MYPSSELFIGFLSKHKMNKSYQLSLLFLSLSKSYQLPLFLRNDNFHSFFSYGVKVINCHSFLSMSKSYQLSFFLLLIEQKLINCHSFPLWYSPFFMCALHRDNPSPFVTQELRACRNMETETSGHHSLFSHAALNSVWDSYFLLRNNTNIESTIEFKTALFKFYYC